MLRKARERLQLAADDAISYLVRVLQDEALEPALRVKVALEIASRTGNVAGLRLDVDAEYRLSFMDRMEILEVMKEHGGNKEAALATIQDPAALAAHRQRQTEVGIPEDEQLQRVLERYASDRTPAPQPSLPPAPTPQELPAGYDCQEVPTPQDDPRVIDATEVEELARYHRPSGDRASEYADGPRTRQARFQR